MLSTYLAGRDVACPQCGYNLRDGVGNRCPECGDELALRLWLAEPRQAPLIAGLIGLSAGAGMSGLLLLYVAIRVVLDRYSNPNFYIGFAVVTGAGFIVEGLATWIWLRQWRRIRRAGRGVRAGLVVACWALTVVNLVVFSVAIP